MLCHKFVLDKHNNNLHDTNNMQETGMCFPLAFCSFFIEWLNTFMTAKIPLINKFHRCT